MSLINTKIKPFKNQAFKTVNSSKLPRKILKAAGASSSSTRLTSPSPDRTGRCGRPLRRTAEAGRDVYSVSTDTHFTHKAWHSSSETIAKIKYAMIGDRLAPLTRNFDNMREDEGLADRATFVVDPQGIIQAIEVTAEGIGRDASDLLRKIKAAQYVASHPGEVARLNGKKVKRLWLRLWTWSAKSKFPSPFTQLLHWRRLLTPVTY